MPVTVIGVGGDGPDSLSVEANHAITQAKELWGSRRLLDLWPDHSARKTVLGANSRELVEQLAASEADGIVVLASGDPGFFGIASTLLERLPPDDVVIVPHVSSLQLAFAKAGVPWSDAVFTSAHARSIETVVGWAKRVPKLGILTDTKNTPAEIARRLLDAHCPDCRVIVAENLETPKERLTDTRLCEAAQMQFAALNVMLLVQDAGWRPTSLLSPRNDADYSHRNGLITKADIRALSLSRLAISDTDILWDIGAGSGAMSIEMAEIAWRGRVYAIEHDAENLGHLRTNLSRYGVLNVEPVAGSAPEALQRLPSPHAVFVGGSGGRLDEILVHVRDAAQPGCRVVVNLATVENLIAAKETITRFGAEPEIAQVSITYGQSIAGKTRLTPINPIFILSAILDKA